MSYSTELIRSTLDYSSYPRYHSKLICPTLDIFSQLISPTLEYSSYLRYHSKLIRPTLDIFLN